MSPRTINKFAKYALQFQDVEKAFQVSYLNKLADESEIGSARNLFMNVFGKEIQMAERCKACNKIMQDSEVYYRPDYEVFEDMCRVCRHSQYEDEDDEDSEVYLPEQY